MELKPLFLIVADGMCFVYQVLYVTNTVQWGEKYLWALQ